MLTITALPPDDRMVESESCDGSNIDMDDSASIVFDNEQVKKEYEEGMNRVDHEAENKFLGD
eukprot:11735642-Ditylum_brightwellii.AAC.1